MENGKCALARNLENSVGFGSTEFHVLRAGAQVLPEWLYYFWRYEPTRQRAQANMTGSAGQKQCQLTSSNVFSFPPSAPSRAATHRPYPRQGRPPSLPPPLRPRIGGAIISASFRRMFGDSATNAFGWDTLPISDVVAIEPQNGIYKPASDYGRGTPILRIDAFYDGKPTDFSNKESHVSFTLNFASIACVLMISSSIE